MGVPWLKWSVISIVTFFMSLFTFVVIWTHIKPSKTRRFDVEVLEKVRFSDQHPKTSNGLKP